MTALAAQFEALSQIEPRQIAGSVVAVRGLTLLVDDLPLPVGALVRLEPGTGVRIGSAESGEGLFGEVIGFDGSRAVVMLFCHAGGVSCGTRTIGEQAAQHVHVGSGMLGRVINGFGKPIDEGGPIGDLSPRPLHPRSTHALRRARINEPLPTGVRAIDGFLTAGRGQRMGIFSAAGVGKSTLLASVARNTTADVNVIALIGERGREVREFIESTLGKEGMKRSVVVVATGDESPLMRVRAALVACATAEHFRDQGADVMILMDSITRFAQAQRQIGLAVGEPPATRGYTPSVFAMIPMILERAGALESGGSITGFYAVLVEGDDLDEPISDAVQGVLDGHIVLSRKLASRGHYPAIDVLASISRLADEVSDRHHIAARQHLRALLAAYADSEDLISIGAYARGSNPDCDVAIVMRDRINEFLRQSIAERAEYPMTCRTMIELSGTAEQIRARAGKPGAHAS